MMIIIIIIIILYYFRNIVFGLTKGGSSMNGLK